ncbi:hypothetical protein IWQ60_010825 [Tieghemiomyces parasiticus]|uniref:HMG box domain-containing protein n=1 Tax=Tieghemiomyces parasiticus TaxID=78921 RepID=A0A9W8DM90_9FUNG|nr:hypothetical protein IWQ60_010825 [Tieghemiomyces parasiticus]
MTVHGSDASEELRREGPMLADETRDIRKRLEYLERGLHERHQILVDRADRKRSSGETLGVDGTPIDRKGILRLLARTPALQKAVDNDDLAYFRTGQKPGDTPRPYITAEEVDELFSSDDELILGTGVDTSDPLHPPMSAQKKLQDGSDALTATGQDTEEPPRKKRRTRRPKDPSAPKKPPNAYFRYRDQELVRLKAQYGNVSGTAITRLISEHWSCLPAEEKQEQARARTV